VAHDIAAPTIDVPAGYAGSADLLVAPIGRAAAGNNGG
jgi:hypothetical protein